MTDKDRILQRTNGGLDVFVHYMGEACKKKVFRNPFRTDNSPSCHLYYNDDKQGGEGRFILKDFGASEWVGDCFWLVGHLTGLDVRTDFMEILRTIDRECELFILDDVPAAAHPVIKKAENDYKASSRPMKFSPQYRNFNKHELAYWSSYGITLDTLSRYHVRCLSSCYFERPDGTHYNIYGTRDVPMFGYTFNNGTGIKVYRPGAEIGRFMYAGNLPKPYVFGLEQLPPMKTDFIIITGGEKDVMTLGARGFHAICLNSETAKVSDTLLTLLSGRCNHLVFLYDCDETGVRESALRVAECQEAVGRYQQNPFYRPCNIFSITLPLAGTKQEKDVSDFFRGGHTAVELVQLVSAGETQYYNNIFNQNSVTV